MTAKSLPKIGKKREKIRKKREKEGKRGKIGKVLSLWPLLTDSAGYATALMPFISFPFWSCFSSHFFSSHFFHFSETLLLLQKSGAARAPSAPLFRGPCTIHPSINPGGGGCSHWRGIGLRICACLWGAFSRNLLWRSTGFHPQRWRSPNYINWVYFRQTFVRNNQFGQKWVLFFRNWYTDGWEIGQKIGIGKVRFSRSGRHIHVRFWWEYPLPPVSTT